MLKWITRIGAVLLVLLIIAGVALYFTINGLIVAGVETGGDIEAVPRMRP